MAEYENLSGLFTGIADAIREKTGSEDLIQAEAFPEAIAGIPTVSGSNQSTVGMISKTIGEYFDNDSEIEYCASSAFLDCYNLQEVSFPVCKSVGMWCFYQCSSMTKATFGALETIDSYAFRGCTSLSQLILTNKDTIPTLGLYALSSTPFAASSFTGTHGSIYVAPELVDEFKTASGWSSYASRITSLENL